MCLNRNLRGGRKEGFVSAIPFTEVGGLEQCLGKRVQQLKKNVKSHVLWILKNVKNVKNVRVYFQKPLDHPDR